MMKSFLLGVSFVALSVSAHAADLMVMDEPMAMAAAPAISGYVGVFGNATTWDYWDDDYNPWVGFGGEAAVAYWLTDDLQVELELSTWSAGDAYYDGYYSPYGTLAAAHLNFAMGQGTSVGVFGGALASSEDYEEGTVYSVLGGVEGQVGLGDAFVLNGQLGYLSGVSGYYIEDDYPLNVLFAELSAKFFPVENLKLEASVGAIAGEIYGEDYDASTLTYGAEVEYKFDDAPFSVFASYSGYADDGYFDSSANTVKVGARIAFGDETLKERATTGASHNVMDLSPVSWMRYGW